ncbi:MAG: AAA family ATPase [Planctomycetaceae bacterium]|nr:AAA family ATPase [Planctomycetaceae bacterium]
MLGPTWHRWASATQLAAVAALASYVLAHVSDGWTDLLHKEVARVAVVSPALSVAACLLLATSLIAFVATIGSFRFKHLLNTLIYPPTSLAAVGAAAMTFAIAFSFEIVYPIPRSLNCSALNAFDSCAILLSIICMISAVSSLKYRFENASLHSSTSSSSIGSKSSATFAWLNSEAPIRFTEDDRFKYVASARLIADRLKSPEQPKTLGLKGDHGTGKSSVVNLVSALLNKKSNGEDGAFLFVTVSCWGFSDSSAALEIILEEVIRRLELEVDALALKGLPAAYHRSVSTSGTLAGILAIFLEHGNSPEKQLRRIESVLRALSCRLVLVIDDLDRNEHSSFDVAQILALLYRFKRVSGVTCVLSGRPSPTGQRIDYEKLCDEIITMPHFGWEHSMSIIEEVQNACMADSHDIDPNTDEHRMTRDTINAYAVFGMRNEARSAAQLVPSPRQLKHVLRHVARSWEKIHGEVVFEELVIVNIRLFRF